MLDTLEGVTGRQFGGADPEVGLERWILEVLGVGVEGRSGGLVCVEDLTSAASLGKDEWIVKLV